MRARMAFQSSRPKRPRDRVAEEDVLGDRQIVEEHRLLVGRGDAAMEGGLGVRDGDGLAVEHDAALRRAGRRRSGS